VVHNFIDASSINAAISVEPACIRDAFPDSIPTVFMAGRIDSTKGFGSFLGSIPSDRLAEMRVRIAGDGPDFTDLRDRYSPLGVKFLGWQDRDVVVIEALAAGVCVVPSICEEACATTVLEGLFLGKPVFALNRGGTPELTRYERFPGQLNLFSDMTSLVQALLCKYVVNWKPAEMGTADLVDVHYRLPEILRIYRNGASRVNAVAGLGKMV
jgi:glycosyltransferase involved in cell wall biosynthesis